MADDTAAAGLTAAATLDAGLDKLNGNRNSKRWNRRIHLLVEQWANH